MRVTASASISPPRDPNPGTAGEYTGRIPTDFRAFPIEAVNQSIPARFAEQVALFPDKSALEDLSRKISYQSLDEESSRVAQGILGQRIDQKAPVALLIEQGIDQVIAMLGILKAGAFYVPLDTTNPVSRLQSIVKDSGASLIVSNNENFTLAQQLTQGHCPVLSLEQINADPASLFPVIDPAPSSLAYVLYTSGTTGRPKGVIHSHETILHNVMRFTNTFCMSPSDRQTMLYNASMYGGQRDILCTILNGATLCFYPLKQRGVAGLDRWLIDQRISIYCSVVTVFRRFLDTLSGSEAFPDVRLVKIGGEAAHATDIRAFLERFDIDCVLHSGLGLTEAGLLRNFFVDHSHTITEDRVPLGYPVEGIELMLLNKDGKKSAAGEVGEIVIRSPYVALGYWRRPELDTIAFQGDPTDEKSRSYYTGDLGILREDGCLEHRGRKDFQVKIRGNRVETVEIETAMLNLPTVREAAVVVQQNPQGDDYLVAYVVAEDQQESTITEIRAELSKALPDFMIPSTFSLLEELPLLPNGKVDRLNLLEQLCDDSQSHIPVAGPRNQTEEGLVDIWSDALRIERVGIRDDFFELGGHSLIAVQIMAEIRKRFGQKLPLATLFKANTIERLAELIQDPVAERWSPMVAIQPSGAKPPLFFIHPAGGNVLGYSEFAEALNPDQPFYALQAYGVIEGQEPHSRVETMAATYVAAIQEVQSHGPYYLGGESFGGAVAFEVAQQLFSKGEEIALLVVGDSWVLQGPHLKPWRYRLSALTYPFSMPWRAWAKLLLRKFQKPQAVIKRYKVPEEVHRKLVLAHRRAKRRYVAKRYHGRITLIRATEYRRRVYRLQHYFGGSAMGWDALAKGGVEIHPIDDTHREIMHGKNAATFAGLLTTCLARARVEGRS